MDQDARRRLQRHYGTASSQVYLVPSHGSGKVGEATASAHKVGRVVGYALSCASSRRCRWHRRRIERKGGKALPRVEEPRSGRSVESMASRPIH
jgi:hypothetical protein